MNELRPKNWSRLFGVTCCLSLLISIVALPILIFGFGNQAQISELLTYAIDHTTCIAFYQNCSRFAFELSALSIVTISVPLIALIISLSISTFLLKSYKPIPQYRHLSGPIVLRGRSAIQHAKKWRKKESGFGGIKLHPKIAMGIMRELGNIFLFGQQGAGKSTIIKFLLEQLLKRNDSLFIYDEKREYTEQFYTGAEVLVSPNDKRGACWDLAKDITDEASAKTVANVLIQSSTQDKFWTDAAQIVLTGVLITLMKKGKSWSWIDLNNLVFSDAQTLHDVFSIHYKTGLNLVEPDSKTSLSILTTLTIQLGWLPGLANQWKDCSESFCLNDWHMYGSCKRLIVAGDPMAYEMSSALCSALLSLLASKIIASPDSGTQRFWFVLDELGNMPKTESLKKLLTLGRSKGVRTIAGTQAVSQLRSIYGNDDAETILSLFSNVIALRTGPIGDSAKVASESFGSKRVEQRVKSYDSSGKESISFQHSDMPAVNMEEIVHLPRSSRTVSGYLLINGYESVYRLDWPIQKRKKIAEAFISKSQNQKNPEESVPVKTESKNRLRRGRGVS
ncbi:type IV secretion system DNA-binding domain-containing protein [Aliiglaciecola lipolytica]|uniref:type IV secretion system DNA-binding domain-containing protein n=1 Tax=Aliiglaciecola lipolytica TaxID=477689 RepID=UPI001C091AE2|nr:type IV secretion system DNA-binding domain-containing protein [Aliiglaciecola lipolytica]MBU2877442.1 type IV secretion system DNA-binding domain-containing protein [Aliiglaciecola lipolytica]